MIHIKDYNNYNTNESKREKIILNGYENWLDIDKQMIFDKEDSKNGIHFDISGEGRNISIRSTDLSSEEKKELLNHIKNKNINENQDLRNTQLNHIKRTWQNVAHQLNSYEYIAITDDQYTEDVFLKTTRNLEKLMLSIKDSKELFEIYLELNNNGIKNLVTRFSSVFDRLEKIAKDDVELNVWDVRKLKQMILDKYEKIK